MMVIVPRIAAVSYLNTIPFIYGIEHEGNLRAELLLSPPSLCAKNFAEHKADIALVPAAAVPSLADAQVVTEYCIGAAGPVRTVVLLSNEPIEKARRVFLDAHSLTSVQLAGYLLAKHWKVTPEYYTLEDYAQLGHALPGDAFLSNTCAHCRFFLPEMAFSMAHVFLSSYFNFFQPPNIFLPYMESMIFFISTNSLPYKSSCFWLEICNEK